MVVLVVDEQTGTSLPKSVIRIANRKPVVTNDEGQVRIENLCQEDYIINISYIGYATQQLTFNPTSTEKLIVKLQLQSRTLQNVAVISERTNLRTSMGKVELKGAELEKTRGLSLADALKEIPGVTTLQTGPTISKPIIQGMHSNRILIINNGIRQEGQQWGSEHAPEIDAFIANKLTVIKGAGSIRYGSDAIGGVILVEPNPLPDTVGVHAELNLVGISNGRQGVVSGIVEGTFKKIPLQWRAQGTLKRAGNIQSPDYYLANTGFYERNFSWAAAYKFRKVKTEFFYSLFKTDIGIFAAAHIGNLTDLENAFNSDTPLISSGFSYKIDRPRQEVLHELFKVKSDYFINSNSKIQLVLARQYNLRNEFDKDLPLNDSLAALDLPELHYEITSYSFDLSYQRDFKEYLTSAIGVTGMFQRNTYEGRQFIPNFMNDGYALYNINQYNKNKWMLDFGLRYDLRRLQVFKVEKDGSISSPVRNFESFNFNAGAAYQLTREVDLHVNFGTAFRAPAVNELYAEGLHHGEGKYIYSSADLNPEHANAVIAGLGIHDWKGLEAHVDGYFKKVDGYIYLMPIFPPTLSIRGAFPSFEYNQVDAYFSGLDLAVQYQWSPKFRSLHKYNLVRAFNTSSNEYLPFIPADRFENGIRYTMAALPGLENSELELRALNVLKQNRLEPNSDYKDSPPAYMIWNLDYSTRVHIQKQHFEVGLTVNNIFNTSYREYMNAFRYFTDEPGTSIIIRIKYHI